MRVQVLLPPHQPVVLLFFKFRHSRRCIVVYHFGFNLYLQMTNQVDHLFLSCHPYVFGTMSVHIFLSAFYINLKKLLMFGHFLYILNVILSQINDLQLFSLIYRLPFDFVDGFLCCVQVL